MSRARRNILIAAACVVVPVALAALVEGGASVLLLAKDLHDMRPLPNFRQAAYDSLVGWVGIANMARDDNFGPGLSLHTNADGMRIHRPVTPALAPGQRRIICSGDSFAFGSGVADSSTFCAYLEQDLPNVTTLNMSQRGYGIDQMYLWYKRDGARYPHQLNIFAFIWNDFERMTFTEFWGYPKPRLRLKDGAIVVDNMPVPRWTGRSKWEEALGIIGQSRLMQLVRRSIDLSDSAQLARVDHQVWDLSQVLFRDLEEVNRERGSALLLVYLPTPNDIAPGPYDERRLRVTKFAHDANIPFLDLTPAMRKLPADSIEWLFITRNGIPVSGSEGHYTAAGHRWAADEMAKYLRETHLLDHGPTVAAR